MSVVNSTEIAGVAGPQKGSLRQTVSAENAPPSAASAPAAAPPGPARYFSPVIRFDPLGQELIVEFRDSVTGEIEQKYPSGWLEQAYQLTGLVETKGPVAVAREAYVAPADAELRGSGPADERRQAAVFLSI